MKKKLVSLFLVFALVLAFSSISVFGAGSVVKEIAGNDGGKDDAVGAQADFYGYIFEGVEPGVYKLGFYFDIDKHRTDDCQLRVSPKVLDSTGTNAERRAWFDFRWNDKAVTTYDESGKEKILMVAVVNIPEGYDKIDAGYWQDDKSFEGTLEKVVLATSDYNMSNDDYWLMGEINYRQSIEGTREDYVDPNRSFGEDADQKLLAAEGSWVASGAAEEPKGEDPTDKPTEKPTDKPGTEKPAETSDASMLVTLLVAGAATVGGLKARKK